MESYSIDGNYSGDYGYTMPELDPATVAQMQAEQARIAQAAAVAANAAAEAAAAAAVANSKKDAALLAAGIDVNQLDGGLAAAVRDRAVIRQDGTVDIGALRFNGLGDDMTGRINIARSDLGTWIPNNGYEQDAGGDSGTTYHIELANAISMAGYGGIVRHGADANAALNTLNTLAGMAQQMPTAPAYLNADEARVFDRLVSETGDGNWARMNQQTLKGVLYSLRLGNDGKLDMSRIYGGIIGYDAGPPNDILGTSHELMYDSETNQYFYYVPDGFESSRVVYFTPPDPSVGSIVQETREGGGDSGSWTVNVYRPSAQTAAKYAEDLARYNETYAKLNEAGGTQVRQGANKSLNIGVDNGYLDASKMSFHQAFGLITSTTNIKYPDSGGGWFDDLMDSIGDIVEVVVPVVLGAVFSYFGGPIGSFVYSYMMSDGDLDKALLSAAATYVAGGYATGTEGAVATAAVETAVADVAVNVAADAAVTTAANSSITGLALQLGVTDTFTAAAINSGAGAALQAIGSGGDFEDVLIAGAIGAAAGYAGANVASEVTNSLTADLSTVWYDGIPTIAAGDAALARNIGQAAGGATSAVVNAALSGESIEDAALRGLGGIVGAALGTGIAGELVGTDNPALNNAVQAGTSALVSGMVGDAINDVPDERIIGSALAAGMNTYIRATTPVSRPPSSSTGAQSYPVDMPGPIEVRELPPLQQAEDQWQWYDDGMPVETVTQPPAEAPTPEVVAETPVVAENPPVVAPAPTSEAEDTFVGPPEPQWQWYDDGLVMPVQVNTGSAPAEPQRDPERDPEPVTTPAETPVASDWQWYDNGEEVPQTASNDNTSPEDASVTGSSETPAPATPTRESQTRTVVVERRGDNRTLWTIAQSGTGSTDQQTIYRQIGQMMVENGLRTSVVRPGQELTYTPATEDNYSPEELAAFERAGATVVRNDNEARAIREAAAAEARRAREAREQAASGSGAPTGGSAPLPYTVPGADGSTGLSSQQIRDPSTASGFLSWLAALVGADSIAIGGTLAPAISAPWTNPAAVTMSGAHFALINSDGYNYFRGMPVLSPVPGGANSWGQMIGRPGIVATASDQGAVSAGVGRTWVVKTPPGVPDMLGFMNLRSEDTPITTVDVATGTNVYEVSYNVGWAVNGNDLAAGVSRGVGMALSYIPVPQTQAAARMAGTFSRLSSGAKDTVGSVWVGAAYQVRQRFNADTGEVIGWYTPQGQQLSSVTDYVYNRVERAINVFVPSNTQPTPDLIDYRLVGP